MIRAVVILCLVGLAAVPVRAQTGAQPTPPPVAVVAPETYQRGIDALNAEDYDRALVDFSLFILLNPTYSRAYYFRAISNLGLEDPDAALIDIDRALATQPDTPAYHAAIYLLRGQIHAQQGMLPEAIDDYGESIAVAPTFDAHFARGRLLAFTGAVDDALGDFDSAIALDDSNPVLFVYRGGLHVQNEDQAAASADYLTFINLIEQQSVEGNALETGQFVTGRMEQGVVFRFPIEAEEGQFLSAVATSARTDAQLDPLIVIVNPDGAPVAGDDDSGRSGTALIRNYEIPADGTYTLLVTHSLGQSSGDVAVGIELSDEPIQ